MYDTNEPLKEICSDICGPFELGKVPNKVWFLTFIDRCSRFSVIRPIKEISSKIIKDQFVKFWIKPYGKPESLLSDQGRQYISSELGAFCKSMNIKQLFSSTYNPTGNSIAERLNQSIGLTCRIFNTWSGEKIAKYVERGVNNLFCTTTGYSPIELLRGRSNLDPLKRNIDINLAKVNENVRIKADEKIVEKNLKRSMKEEEFKLESLVFVEEPIAGKGRPLRRGSYKIIRKKESGNLYLVDYGKKMEWVNIKRLSPFRGGNL